MDTDNESMPKIIEESPEYVEIQGKLYRKDALPPRIKHLIEKYQKGQVGSEEIASLWSSDWSDWSDHSDTGKSIVSNVLHKTLQDILPGRSPNMFPTTTPVVCDQDVD